MGGRGSAGKGGGGAGIITGYVPREIETTYFSAGAMSGRHFKDTVLEASADNDGTLDFSYATPTFHGPSAKTNKTQKVTYSVSAGAVNAEIFGINMGNVKKITGKTFGLRQVLKEAGFTWDSEKKEWHRK